mgnify:FL=1
MEFARLFNSLMLFLFTKFKYASKSIINVETIPIFWPHIPKERILEEIQDTLNGRWLGQGPKVDKFEKEFGKKFGYQYNLFVNSGTSALELAYHLIGLKDGDEVIVPV